MKQHRLMILGSMDEFVLLVQRAKARGIYTIVCDGYPDGPAKAYADKSYDRDIRDIDSVAKLCEEEAADGIITSFSDIMFECMVKIADQAGLPCYLKPDQLCCLRKKNEMKKMFKKLGIETPRSRCIHKEFQDSELKDFSFPVVIKPINGYGSRGIYVVHTIEEIRQRFDTVRKYSTMDDILVEEYNDGYEFNMMSWVADGAVHVLSIADREKSRANSRDIPHVSRITYPSRRLDCVWEDARAVVQKVADFIGMKTGPLSMQFFWSRECGIQVCEITGRMFGYEHELLTYGSGLFPEDLLLNCVYEPGEMAKMVKEHDVHLPHIAAGLYFHGKEGVVRDLSTVRELCGRDSVSESIIYYKEGDVVSHEIGEKPYFIRIYLEAETYEELDRKTELFFEQMFSPDENGENLILSNQLAEA